MLQLSQNREAKQKRATLIAVANRAANNGFREKDQEKRKVAVYNRKAFQSLLRKDLEGTMALDAQEKKGIASHLGSKGDSRFLDNIQP